MDWSQHALPPMRPEPRFGDRVDHGVDAKLLGIARDLAERVELLHLGVETLTQ